MKIPLFNLIRNKMPRKKKVTGASLILAEREKQIKKHKFDVKHDLAVNKHGQLSKAVLKLLDTKSIGRRKAPHMWDEKTWAKMLKKQDKERLITAGALIAAQIDMLLELEK